MRKEHVKNTWFVMFLKDNRFFCTMSVLQSVRIAGTWRNNLSVFSIIS